MKSITFLLPSALLLTGCSLLGEPSDSVACEKLAGIVSTENLSLDVLTPAAIAANVRTEVSPLAEGTLRDRIDALATALDASEVDIAAAGAAASEIGVRCAISGVNFDFSVIGRLAN